MDKKIELINLLKSIRNEKICDVISLRSIDNNKNLIEKGISFDNEKTCYHSYKDIEELITSLMVSANNYGIYYYDEFIGIISVFYQYYKDLTRIEFSISMKEEYRNKGIGEHCYKLLIDSYFANKNIKSIHLSIREDNIKSRKLAEKCGFKLYKGYKVNNSFIDNNGNTIKQVQYLLKKQDYKKFNK